MTERLEDWGEVPDQLTLFEDGTGADTHSGQHRDAFATYDPIAVRRAHGFIEVDQGEFTDYVHRPGRRATAPRYGDPIDVPPCTGDDVEDFIEAIKGKESGR